MAQRICDPRHIVLDISAPWPQLRRVQSSIFLMQIMQSDELCAD